MLIKQPYGRVKTFTISLTEEERAQIRNNKKKTYHPLEKNLMTLKEEEKLGK